MLGGKVRAPQGSEAILPALPAGPFLPSGFQHLPLYPVAHRGQRQIAKSNREEGMLRGNQRTQFLCQVPRPPGGIPDGHRENLEALETLGVLASVSRELWLVPDLRLQAQAPERSVCLLCLFFQKQEDTGHPSRAECH